MRKMGKNSKCLKNDETENLLKNLTNLHKYEIKVCRSCCKIFAYMDEENEFVVVETTI